MFRTRDLSEGQRLRCGAALARTDGPYADWTLGLLHNRFPRSFDTELAHSEGALALPEMGRVGWVRDLRKAMSLSEQQGQSACGALVMQTRLQPGLHTTELVLDRVGSRFKGKAVASNQIEIGSSGTQQEVRQPLNANPAAALSCT